MTIALLQSSLESSHSFHELSDLIQDLIVRVQWSLIPTELKPEMLAEAHEGHPGTDSILRQMR